MSVATKTDHILATVISYLDDDAALQCVKVWNAKTFTPTTSAFAKVFVWPLVDQYGAIAFEQGTDSDLQTMQVGIYCGFFKGAIDTTNAGTLTTSYNAYSERIEKRIHVMNAALRSNPITDTTTVGAYTVGITGATMTNRTGLVDNGDRTEAGFVVTLRVTYVQYY